jgi:hypothetical protein
MFQTKLPALQPLKPAAAAGFFGDPLVLEAAAPDFWYVSTPLIWTDEEFGTLTCPAGFRTDLASIPRALRALPFLDPNGLSRRPAVLHDWLYAWRVIGKAKADAFLRAALIAEGASRATAAAFYYAVDLFGGGAWDSDAGALTTVDFEAGGFYAAWKATPDGQKNVSS